MLQRVVLLFNLFCKNPVSLLVIVICCYCYTGVVFLQQILFLDFVNYTSRYIRISWTGLHILGIVCACVHMCVYEREYACVCAREREREREREL